MPTLISSSGKDGSSWFFSVGRERLHKIPIPRMAVKISAMSVVLREYEVIIRAAAAGAVSCTKDCMAE